MNENINQTSAAFMQITSNKIENQDKRIAAVEEKINTVTDNSEVTQSLISTIESLRTEIKNHDVPVEKMNELSIALYESMNTYKLLLKNKIEHHHHIPKIIWIAAGLFLILSLVTAGWYSTSNKLDSYITNDTKYRYIRLDTSNRSLQHLLDRIDSLYNLQPHMRKIVVETEEKNRTNFERLERAERLKAEAKDLEKAAKKK